MRMAGVLVGLAMALVLSIAAGILIGSVAIGPPEVVSALLGSNDTSGTIVRELRLPRVLGAALVGGALAAAGALLQGLFRNPLADAGLIGVSSGGALGGVIVISTGLAATSSVALPCATFAGALVIAFAIL